MLEKYGAFDLVLPIKMLVRGDDRRLSGNLIETHFFDSLRLDETAKAKFEETSLRILYFNSREAGEIEDDQTLSTDQKDAKHRENLKRHRQVREENIQKRRD